MSDAETVTIPGQLAADLLWMLGMAHHLDEISPEHAKDLHRRLADCIPWETA